MCVYNIYQPNIMPSRSYQDLKPYITKYRLTHMDKIKELNRNWIARKRAFQKAWSELCAIEL